MVNECIARKLSAAVWLGTSFLLWPASTGKMRALAPSSANVAPTSYSRVHRHRCVTVRAAEGFCRDKVNVEGKKFQSQGKVYKLKFMGVGEQAVEVACPDDMYILEAAEQAGLDLPSTCKAGICGTCVGRIAQGSIDPSDIADIEFTITKEEQEQGLAMLCMTRPSSDLVIETQCDWGYSLGVKEWDGATGRFTGTPDPLMGKKWNEGSN
eukprot:GHUV01008193.1.p1 GENE.GHUV01008193.1~~GHUV01008193.1.p1  ORF type:complete len:210 (+),score=11.97 GHUV01008193.1:31-660(+)